MRESVSQALQLLLQLRTDDERYLDPLAVNGTRPFAKYFRDSR